MTDDVSDDIAALDKAIEELQEIKKNEEKSEVLREETVKDLEAAKRALERRLAR